MSLTFAGLQALFQGRHPMQPEDLHPDFKIEIPDVSEDEEHDGSSLYMDAHLAGQVFGIEYETLRGSMSRRWITIEGFKQSKAGDWSLCAYCFSRKGLKSFSLDRVKSLYDAQGEPVTLSEIFPLGSDGAPITSALNDTSGRAIIATCHDGLRALTALAKIDGKLVQSEVLWILKYAEAGGKGANITMTAEDKKAIERYIRNLQPTGDVVADSIKRISEKEVAVQKEFFWYAREVMDADGLQDETEVKMILDISEALSHEI